MPHAFGPENANATALANWRNAIAAQLIAARNHAWSHGRVHGGHAAAVTSPNASSHANDASGADGAVAEHHHPRRVALVPTFAAAASQWDAHMTVAHGAGGKEEETVSDCLHWCQPGVPDSWAHILYAMLMAPEEE